MKLKPGWGGVVVKNTLGMVLWLPTPPSTGVQPVPGILHTLISLVIAGDHIAVFFAP